MGTRKEKIARRVGKGNNILIQEKEVDKKEIKNLKRKKSSSRDIKNANIYTKREMENKINPRNYKKNKKTDKGSGIDKKKKETEKKQENKKKQKG